MALLCTPRPAHRLADLGQPSPPDWSPARRGTATEYATSPATARHGRRPAAGDGAATVIIAGIGLGMQSTAIPVLAVATGTLLAFLFASGFDLASSRPRLVRRRHRRGGHVLHAGITLASDAYGPIADNAGGTAEMCDLGPEVRARTDALDALGNTTAATGKGFAIGSAALTALALIASPTSRWYAPSCCARASCCLRARPTRWRCRRPRWRISCRISMSRCSTWW
ncbi:MAG: sodium/proton-translocating pyrophosphatase [Halioglobus sp.]